MAESKILRYPIRPPVTELAGGDDVESPTRFIDYISFRRYQIAYSDTKSGYYGLNLPNNSVQKEYADNKVYLAIPNTVQTSYNPQYNQVDLGVAGIAAAGLIGTNGRLDDIVSTAQAFAGGSKSEFAASAIAGAANNLGQMLGLAGNLDANSLQALTKGKVFNPFQEQIFKNMAFRTHNFNFKLFARNVDEAKEIYEIIKWMKLGSVPKIGGSGGFTADISDDKVGGSFGKQLKDSKSFSGAASSRFFEVPDKFEIKYKRLSPTGEFSQRGSDLHHRIKDSVNAGISVNYTPDGSYNAFKAIVTGNGDDPFSQVMVPSVTLSLTFLETSIITLDDIKRGF